MNSNGNLLFYFTILASIISLIAMIVLLIIGNRFWYVPLVTMFVSAIYPIICLIATMMDG